RSYAEREAHYRFKENKLHKISIVLQLIIFPIFKFICNYFLKLGFLDRMPGLIYASLMSFHSILVRIYGWQLINHHEY
ncbi:MAG: hypothetical protein U9O78_01255, partial [Patescibacteria group bacterium]|nr:hypothetical protein [Patescibacteria group bacterium]